MLRVLLLLLSLSLCANGQLANMKSEAKRAVGSDQVLLLIDISNAYRIMSPDSAQHYATLALAKARSNRSGIDQIRAMQLLGDLHMDKFEALKALAIYEEARVLVQKKQQTRFESAINRQIGNAFLALKQYENALEKYRKALISAKAAENSLEIARISIQLGQTYGSMGDSLMATRYFSRSSKLARDLDSDSLIIEAALGNYKIYSKKRSYNRALSAYRTFATTSAKVEKLDYENQLTQLRIENATAQDQLRAQIAALTRNITEQSASQSNWTMALLICIGVLLLVCGFLFWSRKNLLAPKQSVNRPAAEKPAAGDSTQPDLSAIQERLVRPEAIRRLRDERTNSH
ncbi:MAG: tetratricopeptide repeat protein [Calditrichia bacterium]